MPYLKGKSLRDLAPVERKEILSVSYWRSGAYPGGKRAAVLRWLSEIRKRCGHVADRLLPMWSWHFYICQRFR